MLVVAIDGTCLDVVDDPATRARLGKGSNQYTATSGYPQILLIALVACGTRAVIDAVFGVRRDGGETGLASSLRTGMIVLLDRGFATNAFLEMVAGTQAANSTKPDRRVTSQLHRAASGPHPQPR